WHNTIQMTRGLRTKEIYRQHTGRSLTHTRPANERASSIGVSKQGPLRRSVHRAIAVGCDDKYRQAGGDSWRRIHAQTDEANGLTHNEFGSVSFFIYKGTSEK
ncbi:hypothetical protein ACJX0J_039429, partial [Zea mays]